MISHEIPEEYGALCSGEKSGPAAAGEKSERPEKNRGAKHAREIGQTVAESTMNKTRGKNGA